MNRRILSILAIGLLAGGWAASAQIITGEPKYPIMRISADELRQWSLDQAKRPRAVIKGDISPKAGAFSLLNNVKYIAAERNQQNCGNCWMWAGTGIMENEMYVKKGIFDRLSIQYFALCGTKPQCGCQGGTIDDVASFYANKRFCVPWSNTGGAFANGDGNCHGTCGGVATTPNYPINSIQSVAVNTYGVGQAQAIANIKNILHQNKAMFFAFFFANNTDWNRFFTFWDNGGETAVFDPAASCGHTWVNGQGGGHAVLLVGYDDTNPANPYWLILNSWGTANGSRPNGLMRWKMNMDYNCTISDAYGTYPLLEVSTLNVEYGGVNRPAVSTDPATAVAANSATLNGTVNPQSSATTYYFEYGLTTAYGSSTPVTSAGAGSSAIAVAVPILNLTAQSTYHFRLVAVNAGGTSYGADRTFTTTSPGPPAPEVTTQPASSISISSAIFNGTVNPRGSETMYFFEYGPTLNYGVNTATSSAGSGSSPLAVNCQVNNLIPAQTFHCRLVAYSVGGGVQGNAIAFTTPSLPTRYTVTAAAGANGGVAPSGIVTNNAGESRTFTATPNPGYAVQWWTLNSQPAQYGGNTYTLTNIQANHSLLVTFMLAAAADAWDPGDDTGAGATALTGLTTTETTHGPHTLSATDPADWFMIRLTNNINYNFNSVGGSGDDFAELYTDPADPNSLVNYDDDSGGNGQFSLSYMPTATGWFYLKVRPRNPGKSCAYHLKYRSLGAPTGGDAWDPADNLYTGASTLTSPTGSEQAHGPHTLSATDLYDWYKVWLTNNVVYNFNSVGGTGDLYVGLYNDPASGVELATDDDSGGNGQFSLSYMPTATGWYYLRVETYYSGYPANYNFKYRIAAAAGGDAWDPGDNTGPGASNLGTPATTEQTHGPHTLSAGDYYDWYAVNLAAGQKYNFNTVGGTGDDYAELFGDTAGSNLLAVDDDSGGNRQFSLDYTAKASGWHYLRVRCYYVGESAAHTLSYQRYASANPPSKPINPNPAHQSTGVGTQPTLTWADGGGATRYEVWFSYDGQYLYKQTNTTATSFTPGPLYPNNTYYWEIDALNASGATEGDVWWFQTGSSGGNMDVTFPANMAGRWASVYAWDNTAQQWLSFSGSGDVFGPAQVKIPNLSENRYYWFGIWDYTWSAWAHAEWFAVIPTAVNGRFVGHIPSAATALIGYPTDKLDITASTGHTVWPVLVNMSTGYWDYNQDPFVSAGACYFTINSWNAPWFWIVFYDMTTGQWF